MTDTTLTYTLLTIEQPVSILYSLFDQCSVFTFEGILGAGKTTLIQKLLERAGVTEVITSPTFTYVSTYQNGDGETFYHFDLYRLKSLDEFLHAGFDEYLYQPHSWSFIEWPEIIEPLIKKRACRVFLDYAQDNKRIMRYSVTADLS